MKFLIAYRLLFSRYNLSFISIISKVSIFGLMLGVGILITVLSVMNGFEKELRDKILSFTSHVNIYPSDNVTIKDLEDMICLLYTSPSPRDATLSRMPSSA